MQAKVLAVGLGRRNQQGEIIPMQTKAVSKHGGDASRNVPLNSLRSETSWSSLDMVARRRR